MSGTGSTGCAVGFERGELCLSLWERALRANEAWMNRWRLPRLRRVREQARLQGPRTVLSSLQFSRGHVADAACCAFGKSRRGLGGIAE